MMETCWNTNQRKITCIGFSIRNQIVVSVLLDKTAFLARAVKRFNTVLNAIWPTAKCMRNIQSDHVKNVTKPSVRTVPNFGIVVIVPGCYVRIVQISYFARDSVSITLMLRLVQNVRRKIWVWLVQGDALEFGEKKLLYHLRGWPSALASISKLRLLAVLCNDGLN